MLGLALGLGVALGLGLGFDPSSPIVRELVLSLTRFSFPLVRFRHNRGRRDVTLPYNLAHKAWVYNYKRDFTVFQVEPTIFSANFCFVFKDACVYIYIQHQLF